MKLSIPPRVRAEWIVGAVAFVSSCAGLLNDFVYDDIPIIRDNARVHELSRFWEMVSRPYWPPPFVEQLFRPIAVLSLSLQYAAGAGGPLVFRVVSYALYVLSAVLLFRFTARSVSRGAALGASLLFAAHPVHVEAVALGVNQGELVVAIAAILMVGRYVARRNAEGMRWADWVYLSLLYAVASLTKENGLVLPGLLAAAEVTLVRQEAFMMRARKLWMGYAALTVVLVLIVLMRNLVLSGGPIGAVAVSDIRGLGLGGRMTLMLAVVPEWARLFVWPARLQADYAPGEIARASSLGWRELYALALVVGVPIAAFVTRRGRPVVSFGLLWCLIGLLPVSNIVPIGVLLAERTLFLPSLGVAIAAAGVGEWALARRPGATSRRIMVIATGLLLVLGVARSMGRHSVWNTEHLRVEKAPAAP